MDGMGIERLGIDSYFQPKDLNSWESKVPPPSHGDPQEIAGPIY